MLRLGSLQPYISLLSSSIFNQRYMSETNRFPSVNYVAVQYSMKKAWQHCVRGSGSALDGSVESASCLIAHAAWIMFGCARASKSFCFPRCRGSRDVSLYLQQHTCQYMSSQSLTSFSLSFILFGTQQSTQIDLFTFLSYFNNLELMRLVM